MSNSNVGLCLHKGARGVVEVEAREQSQGTQQNLMAFGQGTVTTGG